MARAEIFGMSGLMHQPIQPNWSWDILLSIQDRCYERKPMLGLVTSGPFGADTRMVHPSHQYETLFHWFERRPVDAIADLGEYYHDAMLLG